jgi:hypothetical protein
VRIQYMQVARVQDGNLRYAALLIASHVPARQ